MDAHGTSEWRKKGFYPIISTKNDESLLTYLTTKLEGIESGKQSKYLAEESRVCIDSTDKGSVEKFKKTNPAGRMPFGFPALNANEISVLTDWQSNGFEGPKLSELESKILNNKLIQPLISKWEKLFNGQELQTKLSSRYLYEHLFLASIYFVDHPDLYFRLVRSKTEYGPIHEIGTSFPFDDPGSSFFYRLRPVTNTLVHKSVIPFEFSNLKFQKISTNFFKANWGTSIKKLPSYGRDGSNPFLTFKDIPVDIRYNFFLENAAYHVMTFIKGPVCRGQTALNVINDHFWVLFLDPKTDVMVNNPEAYDKIAQEITFPAEINSDFSPTISFREKYWQSVKTKFSYLNKLPSADTNWIWSGDKADTNAVLTVNRHFDSATVMRGLRGQKPKTVWILDYHVFESIYYNLSAGYNVFGPLLHQLNSRLYMDVSRIASEDLFISLFPQNSRLKIRSNWNQKIPKQKETLAKNLVNFIAGDVQKRLSEDFTFHGDKIKTNINGEVLKQIIKSRFSEKQLLHDEIEPFRKLLELKGKSVASLPDTLLVYLKNTKKIFTLVHNKSHYNVSMLLFEDERRKPADDNLDIINGVATSYVNAYVILDESKVNEFVKDLSQINNPSASWNFLKKYALSRSNKDFWKLHGEISALTTDPLTNERGILDLNRYINL